MKYVLLVSMALMAACGSGDFSAKDTINSIEAKILARTAGDKGVVLASIEGDEIHRKLFDLQFDMMLKTSKLPPEQQVRARNDARALKEFLRNMIYTRVILNEIDTDPQLADDTEFLLFMYMAMNEAAKQYYLVKKVGDSISTNVSDEEVGQVYNRYKNDPNFKDRIARIPFDQLTKMIRQEILQNRQMQLVQEYVEKVKGKYRVEMKDELLGGSPAEGEGTR